MARAIQRAAARGDEVPVCDCPCRRACARGTVAFRRASPPSHDSLDVTVEGFDPVTGATTWSVAVGNAPSLAYGEASPGIAGATTIAIARPDGPLLLDYATGATEAPSPDATFWCMAPAYYEHASIPSTWTDVWQIFNQRGGSLAFICDGQGRAAARLPSAAATRAVGATVGGYAVVATRDGFYGFAAAPP
jgi:hypothetical protein